MKTEQYLAAIHAALEIQKKRNEIKNYLTVIKKNITVFESENDYTLEDKQAAINALDILKSKAGLTIKHKDIDKCVLVYKEQEFHILSQNSQHQPEKIANAILSGIKG